MKPGYKRERSGAGLDPTKRALGIAAPLTTDFNRRVTKLFRLKRSFQSVLAGALVCALLLSALPSIGRADERPGNDPAAVLPLLHEAMEAARDRGVKESLKGVRRALEEARDHRKQGDQDATIADISRAHDALRSLIDS